MKGGIKQGKKIPFKSLSPHVHLTSMNRIVYLLPSSMHRAQGGEKYNDLIVDDCA